LSLPTRWAEEWVAKAIIESPESLISSDRSYGNAFAILESEWSGGVPLRWDELSVLDF
jgi:hypothetical protein